ncbi:MAG TPA: hypothetical protein VGI74_08540 [Streptosporangiaceae bacterium]
MAQGAGLSARPGVTGPVGIAGEAGAGESAGRHRRPVPPGEAEPGLVSRGAPGHVEPTALPRQAAGGYAAARPGGSARARIRRKQGGGEPVGSPVRTQPGRGPAGHAQARRQVPQSRQPQSPIDPGQGSAPGQGRGNSQSRGEAAVKAWYEVAGGWQRTDGSSHCGSLEPLVHRHWDNAATVPAEALLAVQRLAGLPQRIKDLLAAAVDAIYVGPGGVPELDDMGRLRGVPLPSGRATWDACAGAYGDRKIVVGTRPSPSPDVMCHEVGHAIDDSDAPAGRWQSDSAEFRMLYDQCLPHLVSDFHRQQGALGRREFFADAFAAIASRQRPALVDMLGGSTRVALNVMLYFNRRYSI